MKGRLSASGAPQPRLPALAVLGRFSPAAWRASPLGAVADAALTLIGGSVPVADLWAARGLVNAIAGAVRQPRAGPGSLPLLLAPSSPGRPRSSCW